MAFSGPLDEGPLLLGAGPHGRDVDYVIERPAEDGLPEVVWIVDDIEGPNLPIFISSDEDEEDEVEIRLQAEVEGIPPLSFDDEDEEDGHQPMEMDEEEDNDEVEEEEDEEEEDQEEEEEDEEGDLDDDGDFSALISDDSGYDTMTDDEEEPEDDDDEDIWPPALLVQEFPPEDLWHGQRRPTPPVSAGVALPLVVRQQVVVFQAEVSVPSTSGLSCSSKRPLEESSEQVGAKRPRWTCEDRPQESVPSTSGLSSSTTRTREEDYRDSAPSTSGLSSSSTRRLWPWEFPRRAYDSDSDSD